jgi:hypothetical protein
MVVIFALLGYLNIRLHRQHLEAATLASAERVSDVIKRSTAYYMLRNDREGLYHTIQTMADEPGIQRSACSIKRGPHRLLDRSHGGESRPRSCRRIATPVCCGPMLARLRMPDRFRIYRDGSGQRILRVLTAIDNQPSCSERVLPCPSRQ